MILCKFTKTDSAVYTPHLDLLREMGRAVRRANLNVRFSEGFNPHMLLFFSQPLPLGLASTAEYFCADSDEEPTAFMDGLNVKLPRGVRVLSAVRCEKASVHAEITHAKYRYKTEKTLSNEVIQDIMSRIVLEIPVKTKKGMANSDIRSRIYFLEKDGDDIVAVLGCGKENLRADSFGNYLSFEYALGDYEVVKEDSFIAKDGILKTVDEVYGL